MKNAMNLAICSVLSTVVGLGIGMHLCCTSKNAKCYRRAFRYGANAGYKISDTIVKEMKDVREYCKKEAMESL